MFKSCAIVPDDVEAAWRFFLFNWVVVGATAATLALSLLMTDFTIGLGGLLIAIGYVAIYAGFAHANARSPVRRDPQVMFVLGASAQIALATAAMAPLTYVGASLNFPMQDAALLAVDRALGLDWGAYANFVNDRPTLASWLNYAYAQIGWPLFAIPVVLAAVRRYRRIEEFTFAFVTSLAVTAIISALVPAIGVYQQIGLDPGALKNIDAGGYLDAVHYVPPTRDGALRHLELLGLGGIVTFPSFHATSAVLFAWALWAVRWLRPFALLVNGAMLAATPLNGGHYFIDVIAGVVIAVLSIVAARRIGQVIARRQADAALRAPMPAMVPAE
jgi:membrane-associated phospholipid phosphatase